MVHKVNVALKELVETRGWLRFIIIAQLLSARRIDGLLEECEELCRILGKSVSTAKANGQRSRGGHLPIRNLQ